MANDQVEKIAPQIATQNNNKFYYLKDIKVKTISAQNNMDLKLISLGELLIRNDRLAKKYKGAKQISAKLHYFLNFE